MLTFVPTPIGNIEDITFRAIKALEDADIFLCEDTRVTKKLLKILVDRFSIKLKSNSFISFHEHNQDSFLSTINLSFFDKNIVYLSDAGMPSISDPGVKLVQFCQKNSIKYDILPGANAAIVAFVASGFDGEFTFFGFLPSKGSDRKKRINTILNHKFFSIVYEAPHRLLKLLEEIKNIDQDRLIFVAKELSKKYQEFYKDRVDLIFNMLSSKNIKGEWVVVISPKKDQSLQNSLTKEDILPLDIPKKQKAKLLSKITAKSAKEWYEELISN